MKSKIKFVLLLILVSCNSSEFLNYIVNEAPPLEEDPVVIPDPEIDSKNYPIKFLLSDNNIDVLLVVDNSGSMADIQKNVETNAGLFFSKFAKNSTINWKLGLISTDIKNKPYLGFNNLFASSEFNTKDPTEFAQMVSVFQTAVSRLGTVGSHLEYVFYNIQQKLNSFSFKRADSHLVVIMISDEPEQSEKEFKGAYKPGVFYNSLLSEMMPGKFLRFYGAISHDDFIDCDNYSFRKPKWIESNYKRIIDLSGGFNISACAPDFGNELGRVGEDIGKLVGEPSLLLSNRPDVDTLRVYYKDKTIELKPGAPETGGEWYYDEEFNTITFYNLDFVEDIDKDTFLVEFEIDDGITRPIDEDEDQ